MHIGDELLIIDVIRKDRRWVVLVHFNVPRKLILSMKAAVRRNVRLPECWGKAGCRRVGCHIGFNSRTLYTERWRRNG